MSALPELPEPLVSYAKCSWAYEKHQLQAYGDARAAHARKSALEEVAVKLETGDITSLRNDPEILTYLSHVLIWLAKHFRSLK